MKIKTLKQRIRQIGMPIVFTSLLALSERSYNDLSNLFNVVRSKWYFRLSDRAERKSGRRWNDQWATSVPVAVEENPNVTAKIGPTLQ